MENMESEAKDLPLSGLNVIDCATLLAGPMMAMFLADFGAEVIKVEHPKRGDPLRQFGRASLKNGDSSWWVVYSRNKKTITLDLSKFKGQEIFKKLVKNADILVENFRPGTLEKWGLGYDELKKINPQLIMLRVTGFGQNGPYRDRPGFGTLAEAMSGYAAITGYSDGPPTLPSFALADGVAALCGAYAVMFSVYHRDVKRTGEGQYIDLSLYEPLMTILGSQITDYDQLGIIEKRLGSRLSFTAPRNAYKTKDERWVALSASAQTIAERVFKVVGREDLIENPRFKDNRRRVENVEELDAIIGGWIHEHTFNEVMEKFEKYEAAIAPIYDASQILEDSHFKARGSILEIDDPKLGKVKMQNLMPILSKTPGRIRHIGPSLGEYNHEIYVKKLGLSEAEVAQLKEEGVV